MKKPNNKKKPLVKSEKDQIEIITSELTKVVEYLKILENKTSLLIQTLDRLNICPISALSETQDLSRQKEMTKKKIIKDLLEGDHTVREYLIAIAESPSLPYYEKMKIDPVKDLNLNPYEVAQVIKDDFSEKTLEEQVKLGVILYNLNKTHF